MTTELHHGDCIDIMRTLPENSVDSIVTDPPYGLGFMGKKWDALPPGEEWAREALRVLKPGGHLLAFGGTRTWHRLAVAVEDAGFEIRDSIAWMYGSGVPKSHDVAKGIDKLDAAGERLERARTFQQWLGAHMTPSQVNRLTGTDMGHHLTTHPTQPAVATADLFDLLRTSLPEVPAHIEDLVRSRTVESQNFKARKVIRTQKMVDTSRSRLGFAGQAFGGVGSTKEVPITTAHTEEAAKWEGWGTALKPAFEPIVMARKPFKGTVAANVQAHGTGALNVDACRIGAESTQRNNTAEMGYHGGNVAPEYQTGSTAGRWPANVVLDEHAAAVLDGQSGVTESVRSVRLKPGAVIGNGQTHGAFIASKENVGGFNDSGGASRFFKVAEPDEHGAISPHFPREFDAPFIYTPKAPKRERPVVDGVAHATVKPLTLMRHLVKLVTPAGGTVLEPFAGSGTTVEACILEGFDCIAIEREAEYLPLIHARIERAK